MAKTKLERIVMDFDNGKSTAPITYKHKTEKKYIELDFNVYEDQRDVFIREIVEIVFEEDVEVSINMIRPQGSSVLIEKNAETPTLYGNKLPYKKLLEHIEENYTKVLLTTSLQYIGNEDSEWEYLEEYL